MIIVVATVDIQQGKETAFVEGAQDCIEKTRKEQGNISYQLLNDTASKSKFLFLEEWADKASLDAHMKTEHFMGFGTLVKTMAAGPLAIHTYDAQKTS